MVVAESMCIQLQIQWLFLIAENFEIQTDRYKEEEKTAQNSEVWAVHLLHPKPNYLAQFYYNLE
jgi:hypothetical protein